MRGTNEQELLSHTLVSLNVEASTFPNEVRLTEAKQIDLNDTPCLSLMEATGEVNIDGNVM